MPHSIHVAVVALGLSVTGCDRAEAPAVTSQTARVQHYEGLPAENWDQALNHLAAGQDSLRALLGRRELGPLELNEIHQLTYTLENALERVRSDLGEIAEALEAVHIASESNDPGTVQGEGARYLRGVERLLSAGRR
jgi:hypothetical protein